MTFRVHKWVKFRVRDRFRDSVSDQIRVVLGTGLELGLVTVIGFRFELRQFSIELGTLLDLGFGRRLGLGLVLDLRLGPD